MSLVSNLFFTDIDFCKPRVISMFRLKSQLHLSILLRGT